MDPTMERAYQGSEKGAGAKMTWKGNQVGKGSVLITKGEPAKGITYDLEFEDGKYRSGGELRFEPVGSDTRVVWTNDGDAGWNPMTRVFNLFMDRLIGPDFQKGLDKLKTLAEARA
jgi:hypothetical protein